MTDDAALPRLSSVWAMTRPPQEPVTGEQKALRDVFEAADPFSFDGVDLPDHLHDSQELMVAVHAGHIRRLRRALTDAAGQVQVCRTCPR